jgi:hypothetical protein
LGLLPVQTMPRAFRSGHMGRQPVVTLNIPFSSTLRILGPRQTGSSARTNTVFAGPTLAPAVACGTSGGQWHTFLCDPYWNKRHGVTAGGDRWKNNSSLLSRAPRAAIVHVELRYIEPINAVSACQSSSESCRMHRASIQIYSYPRPTIACKASRKILVSLNWWMSNWKSCSVSSVSIVNPRSPQQ